MNEELEILDTFEETESQNKLFESVEEHLKEEKEFIEKLKSLKKNTPSQKKTIKYIKEGSTYFGNLNSKNQREGYGEYTNKSGSYIYYGYWKEDKKQGECLVIFDKQDDVGIRIYKSLDPNGGIKGERGFTSSYADYTLKTGEKYEGEFFEGDYHGKGMFLWVNGNRYTGEFKNDKLHGKGTYIWANGDKFVGNYINNQEFGEGIMYFSSGARYEGNFTQGEYQGFGKYFYPSGHVYSGNWRDNYRHGEGVMTFPNNALYEGDWVQGEREGYGIFVFSDGSRYEGSWMNGVRHGSGVYYDAYGDVEYGVWNFGEIVREEVE